MALREDDARFALPLGGAGPRLTSEVVDFLLACRPEWHRDALCTEFPGIDWFDHDQAGVAGAVCARCSVRGECGTYAVENGVSAGMWAGVVRDPPRRKRPPLVASDGAPPAWVAKERAMVAKPEADLPQVSDPGADLRQGSTERPPPPATCQWCPMPAKKGHELCKSCEREMVERFAV